MEETSADRYSKDIGLFVTIDFYDFENCKRVARGILTEITSEGRLKIIHTSNKLVTWEIDPELIKSYNTGPIKKWQSQ